MIARRIPSVNPGHTGFIPTVIGESFYLSFYIVLTIDLVYNRNTDKVNHDSGRKNDDPAAYKR